MAPSPNQALSPKQVSGTDFSTDFIPPRRDWSKFGQAGLVPGKRHKREDVSAFRPRKRMGDNRPASRGGSAHATWRHREVTSGGTQARLSRFLSSD